MGFLKTVIDVVYKIAGSFAEGLGLNKPIKKGQNLLKESLTFKGGIFDKNLTGDSLQRKLASDQAKSNEEILKELKLIREQLRIREEFYQDREV